VSAALILIFWIIYPLFALFASSFLVGRFNLKKRLHIKAVDIALPLIFIGIHALSMIDFGDTIILYFLISILLLAISVAFFQAYFYEELIYKRFAKMFWRLAFLVTMLTYLILIVVNLVIALRG
jgi:hypothetical protein